MKKLSKVIAALAAASITASVASTAAFAVPLMVGTACTKSTACYHDGICVKSINRCYNYAAHKHIDKCPGLGCCTYEGCGNVDVALDEKLCLSSELNAKNQHHVSAACDQDRCEDNMNCDKIEGFGTFSFCNKASDCEGIPNCSGKCSSKHSSKHTKSDHRHHHSCK